MLKLIVDPAKEIISISVNLVGEKDPITINIDKYSINQKGKNHYLRVGKISINKKWMDILAKGLLKNAYDVSIPAEVEDLIKIVK